MKRLATSAAEGPSNLGLLIAEFARRLPGLATRSGSANRCKFVSYELACYLRKRGIKAVLVHVAHVVDKTVYPQAWPKWAAADAKDWTHYVVKVGHRAYDLTARQFDPQADRVMVYTIPQLRSLWHNVETDHFMDTVVGEILGVKNFNV